MPMRKMPPETEENNVVWHHATVTRKRREAQRSVILWFTGLSSAGKSTSAPALTFMGDPENGLTDLVFYCSEGRELGIVSPEFMGFEGGLEKGM